MTKLQSVKSKKGEVNFRKKLTLQFTGKSEEVIGHPNQDEHSEIVRQRVNETRKVFKTLRKKGITLSPYLEIGAEIGHRSMLLENEFNAKGYIADISYESLNSGKIYLKLLGYKKMPIAICCDAYNLPFPTSSIPFIFCYQTLHHFPNPKPILKEIKRVLAPGGHLYFSEEPISQTINLNLWRRDYNLTWYEKILKKIIILHFISRIGKSEVEHDILEETFDLKTWQNALNIFPFVEATLRAFPFGPSSVQHKSHKTNWIHPSFLKKTILQFLGGGIAALCRKNGKLKITDKNLYNFLACPNCKSKPKLKTNNNFSEFKCPHCGTGYKKRGIVHMLLDKNTNSKLYNDNYE